MLAWLQQWFGSNSEPDSGAEVGAVRRAMDNLDAETQRAMALLEEYEQSGALQDPEGTMLDEGAPDAVPGVENAGKPALSEVELALLKQKEEDTLMAELDQLTALDKMTPAERKEREARDAAEFEAMMAEADRDDAPMTDEDKALLAELEALEHESLEATGQPERQRSIPNVRP